MKDKNQCPPADLKEIPADCKDTRTTIKESLAAQKRPEPLPEIKGLYWRNGPDYKSF